MYININIIDIPKVLLNVNFYWVAFSDFNLDINFVWDDLRPFHCVSKQIQCTLFTFVTNGLLLLPRNLFDLFTHVVRASVLIILLCCIRNYVEGFNRLFKWSYLYDFTFLNCMKNYTFLNWFITFLHRSVKLHCHCVKQYFVV